MNRWAIVAGAVVGFATGLLGLVVGALVHESVALPMLGAVCGGATAAWLTDAGIARQVLAALLADLLSSAGFFLLVTVGYPMLLAITTMDPVAAIAGPLYFIVFGLVFAIPVALVSAIIAVISGLLTGLLKEGLGARPGPDAPSS